ncbi:phosphinothricin acetyltransferase [Selenomonas ruminantium]|uniref:Phosphinothricin acetyltransferase n=1 Tax=Selenomonas ruminantium TaxID=971 RepID=A0A1M6U6R9_SELRU|nr:GNAT family N-acetyltransferase [Selenomonas ruminantium]SHK64942.1 phosphinothricin acetyltransferase [Selenomonas ruminantium]
MKNITIRPATPEDAADILAIYSYYVEKTAITFEIDVPSLSEFQARITKTLTKYPYLAAIRDEHIVGYAYASTFKDRAAYDHSVELTIYLSPNECGQGTGRKLYTALEKALSSMGIINLYACIGDPLTEDEYLTHNSENFHAHLGFTKVGTFHKCGRKFGRWYNMIWMEKFIGQHD